VSLRKRLTGEGAEQFFLDLQFTAATGLTVLFGTSGSGKTTVLDCIAGLRRPDSGKIVADNVEVFDSASAVDVPTQHREVGYLFQTLALFPHMTARQNIEYGLAALNGEERASRVGEIADSFGISHVLERRPRKMSGGERQRVALARALVRRPRVLLLDEPMTALDAATKARIVDDLRRWIASHAVPVLYVTHDRGEVYALGDRVLVLENGRIISDGTPHEVLGRPAQESVAQLAGFENIFNCEAVAEHPEQGTMTCRILPSGPTIEAPLTRVAHGSNLRLGIRAGDILLANAPPQGLSARNVIAGRLVSLRREDVTVIVEVDCGAKFLVHLTPVATDFLQLTANQQVWLVVKTYSCHILQA
jgi:molybdate transport system ATP-binding protein